MDIWVASMFWLLWIVLLWTSVYKYLFEYLFSILLGINLGVELLGHMTVLFYIFEELQNFFSKGLHLFTFPQAMYKCSYFSTSLSTLVIFQFFDYSQSVGAVERASHYDFDLHFLNDQWSWISFHVFFGHLYISFGEMSIDVFYPFSCLFIVKLYEYFIYSDSKPLSDI